MPRSEWRAGIPLALRVPRRRASPFRTEVVSWNFKHIVRLDRIKSYNQVNLSHGYGIMTIVSPKEVRFDG